MRAYLLALAILGSAAPQAVNAPTAVTNGAGPSFTQPRPAPPTYVSVIYGLTFPSPPGTTYCPLPDGWIGSDHGTILFLEPPTGCGDAGYPSSARGFVSRRTPRIQLYYGYVVRDDPVGQRCPGPPVMEFLGRARPLCRSHDDGMVEVTVSG